MPLFLGFVCKHFTLFMVYFYYFISVIFIIFSYVLIFVSRYAYVRLVLCIHVRMYFSPKQLGGYPM